MCPEENILFRKSDGLGSVTDGIVFLPEKISFFNDFELNRKVYLHKALVAAIIRRHGISFIKGWEQKRQRAFQIRAYENLFKEYLRIELGSYENFFSELFARIREDKYKKEKSDHVFRQWTKGCQRLDRSLSRVDHSSELRSLYSSNGVIHVSRLSYYPMAELMLYCGFMTKSPAGNDSMDSVIGERKSQSYETEIEGKNVSGTDLKLSLIHI